MRGFRRTMDSASGEGSTHPSKPELTRVALPSSLSPEYRVYHSTPALLRIEEQLREAAARDALGTVRRHLRTRIVLNTWRHSNVRGVKSSTRLGDALRGVGRRTNRAANEYRRHRAALLALRGPGAWENELKELQQCDLRGINERALKDNELAERQRVSELTDAINAANTTTNTTTASISPSGSSPHNDNFDIDELDVGGVSTDGQLGEGYRRLSWIWTTGLSAKDMADFSGNPQMHAGTFDVSQCTELILTSYF
jgi:hypothetical protein